jgi:predicted HTH transcriptional regulator
MNTEAPRKTIEESILSLLGKQPSLTERAMAVALEKSFSTVARTVRKLREEGRLRHVGPKKGGHWEIM